MKNINTIQVTKNSWTILNVFVIVSLITWYMEITIYFKGKVIDLSSTALIIL